MAQITLPGQGQLVEVRGRRYAVMNLQASTLPVNPVHLSPPKGQHLLTLASVEDDGVGEELEVIWELEQGATLFEERELPYPDGFDSGEAFSAFLDAVRWGAVSLADRAGVQSPGNVLDLWIVFLEGSQSIHCDCLIHRFRTPPGNE